MIKINRILCATDLTTDSDQALRYALALARSYEAKLGICYCATERDIGSTKMEADSLQEERTKQVFENALRRFLTPEAIAALDWQGLLVEGKDVGETLTATAAAWRADLIVMRSRRRPHRAALLGSTAESVSRNAPCPVLVTHTDERDFVQPLSESITLERVLVPYDFSDWSELALKSALLFAQEYQADLHLIHVLRPHPVSEPEIAWYPIQGESAYHVAARRLQKAVPAEAQLWCKVTHVVSEGCAYREILNYAEKNAIDLIFMGAHGAGFGTRALFGSNVDRVLRQAPCPVLVARPLKPAIPQNVKRDYVSQAQRSA